MSAAVDVLWTVGGEGSPQLLCLQKYQLIGVFVGLDDATLPVALERATPSLQHKCRDSASGDICDGHLVLSSCPAPPRYGTEATTATATTATTTPLPVLRQRSHTRAARIVVNS